MSEYRVVQDYPDPPERVWCALTDPEIVPLWTSTGRGGKPVGFVAVVGTRFKFVGKPTALSKIKRDDNLRSEGAIASG